MWPFETILYHFMFEWKRNTYNSSVTDKTIFFVIFQFRPNMTVKILYIKQFDSQCAIII